MHTSPNVVTLPLEGDSGDWSPSEEPQSTRAWYVIVAESSATPIAATFGFFRAFDVQN
jgi:hypothetical protein